MEDTIIITKGIKIGIIINLKKDVLIIILFNKNNANNIVKGGV